MKKKIFCLIALIIMLIPITGCGFLFGTHYFKKPEQYGKRWVDSPSFLPASIAEYQVNSYSYTLYEYFDICYEIFLDITVTKEQFEQLIANAKSQPDYTDEKASYYCDGYLEIVYQDYYETDYETSKNVGWSDIDKIIYNPETLNIVYVSFHANDTGVYNLADVAYFNRFSINQNEYVAHLNR